MGFSIKWKKGIPNMIFSVVSLPKKHMSMCSWEDIENPHVWPIPINETKRIRGINIKNVFTFSTPSSASGPPCIFFFS